MTDASLANQPRTASASAPSAALSRDDVSAIDDLRANYKNLRAELAKVIIGQDVVIERLLICILARGHGLLMGVPGLAKTTIVNALAQAMSLGFNRIQFTPDLMPSDITGTDILQETDQPGRRAFVFVKGPLFANIILADEINRTPPKTQSALLEAMQEHRVTVAGRFFALPAPFFVLATQNPIEQEGTYPLPEAQVDRFMLKVVLGYPSMSDERKVVDGVLDDLRREVQPVLEPATLAEMKQTASSIYLDDKVKDYVLDLVSATRHPEKYKLSELKSLIQYGASPRASINLCLAARANAFLVGRGYVTPQDVKDVALDILRHRVLLTYEAEAEETTSDDVVRKVLESVPVP
jgi:MoxR-like ATPase